MPPPPAAEPAMSGTMGSGAKGDLRSAGPPAPPRRPRSRTAIGARGRRSGTHPGGEVRERRLGPVAEKKSCVASTAPAAGRGRAAAGRPPCRRSTTRRAGAPAWRGAIGVSTAGAAGLSGTAMGVASSPGAPGLELVAAAGSASSAHVQFHTQFQPARGALAGALRHAPVQFHTQVQVSGAPGALTRARRGVGPGGARAVARGARLRVCSRSPPWRSRRRAPRAAGRSGHAGSTARRRRRRSPRGWPRRRRRS